MEPEKKSNGALVGLIIIVIILVVGGFYLWKVGSKEVTPPAENPTDIGGTSEDTLNIETDLNSIDLDSLDEGL